MLTNKKTGDLKKVYQVQTQLKSCNEVLETIIKEIEENDKPPTKGQSIALKRQANKKELMNHLRQMDENRRFGKPVRYKRK
ncbi:MAG: hypothetical protein IPP60_06280 [Sphingobacteriales bacterium]|nr:hypothetical protein [Sphingobacteriales bacterium]